MKSYLKMNFYLCNWGKLGGSEVMIIAVSINSCSGTHKSNDEEQSQITEMGNRDSGEKLHSCSYSEGRSNQR